LPDEKYPGYFVDPVQMAKMEKKTVFFRNDDVGLFSANGVSPELIKLTQIFLDENIPISHGVVPAAINDETVNWLIDMKEKFPNLIGIDQHGYRHVNYDGCGEFGVHRNYKKQESDIKAGLELMKEYFGDCFSFCFSPQWNKYDSDTKRICDGLGYKVFSGAVSPKLHARILVRLGQMLNKNMMLGKPISYHRRNGFNQCGFELKEISVGVSVVKSYKNRELKSLDEIMLRFEKCCTCQEVVGINLHHWVFNTSEKRALIGCALKTLRKKSHVSFKLLAETGGI
jgi:hypothetical protein